MLYVLMNRASRAIVELIVIFICLVACSGSDSKYEPSTITKGPFEETISQLDTPELIDDFMRTYIRYTSKGFQWDESRRHGFRWKSPKETYDDGYGFCYDLSAFALHCLLEHGYNDAKILFVCFGDWGNESNSGHLVSLFSENGQDYLFNDGRVMGPFSSFDEILDVASHGYPIKYYRFFKYEEIPFQTKYDDMDYFCRTP